MVSRPRLLERMERGAEAKLTAEAVRHAFAAEDFERAADLIELAMPAMLKSRQDATLRGWLERLPDELVRLRPVLSAGYVGLLLHVVSSRPSRLGYGTSNGAWRRRPTTARLEGAPAQAVFVDEGQFRGLPGLVALYRAGYA